MMRRAILPALSCFLTVATAPGAAARDFAHFLEPGFPFAEIVVDARGIGEGFPPGNLSPRGLVVRLAEGSYIAYDTDLLRMAVAWTGGFLTEENLATMSYHDAKKKKGGGQKVVPAVIGEAIVANGLYPGVQIGSDPRFQDPRPPGKDPREIGRGALPPGMGRWVSASVLGERVLVSYQIGAVLISEVPWMERADVIGRHFQVAAHPGEPLTIILGSGHCRLLNPPPGAQVQSRDGVNYVILAASEHPQRFAVLQSSKRIDGALPSGELPEGWDTAKDHWPLPTETRGILSETDADFVVDSIPLPLDNPQRRNVRPTGIDFFDDGSAAVVTFDGDVWIVTGLGGDLEAVTWKRIAGGLHEPNSVRIRDGQIFVFGRNGITRIVRGDGGGGEALVYENFCSDFWQSTETRDFAHSMAVTRDGGFLVTKGGQQNDLPSKHSGRVIKISPDGKRVEVFADGLRNAYLCRRPGTDEIYASDQQGHWVPATPLHRIVQGGYYGFQPAAPWGVPEPPITPPLCWIPHSVAGSGLGPVWADAERFGPLSDSLVYLDFRLPGLLRTYLNDHPGQAATVPMPTTFDFPLLKAAVNPIDGQLYLVGFQIWGTSAEEIGGMARLRYTGKASLLPERVVAGKHAIALHFGQPLDPSFSRFNVRRWNYRRSSDYGSGHFRPDGKAGEEILRHGGVAFSADRRSVLISTPELSPVQQLAVSYELKTGPGERFANAAYLTLHEIHPLDLEKEGFPDCDLAALGAARGDDPGADPASAEDPTSERGALVYQAIGCAACHSIDGSTDGKSGPTWKGLAGSKRQLMDGKVVKATSDYLRESILNPAVKVTKGYNPKDVGMPSYRGILSDSDVESVILFIESLGK